MLRQKATHVGLVASILYFSMVANGQTIDLLVSSSTEDAIKRFAEGTGTPLPDFVSSGAAGLDHPLGMTYGPNGNFYVSSNDLTTTMAAVKWEPPWPQSVYLIGGRGIE